MTAPVFERVEVYRDEERQQSALSALNRSDLVRAEPRTCDSCRKPGSPCMVVALFQPRERVFVWACEECVDAVAVAMTVREW